MKKSAVLFVVSTLVISACSKSDGGGSGAPANGINPYGTGIGQSANPASFGFWQMDRVQNLTADGTSLVHLNSGRVMSETFSIDQANVEFVGFPDDLVHPYRGGYQLNGQTLILVGNNGGNQFPIQQNPRIPNQQGIFNPAENLVMNLVNANELTIGTRHFHRIAQNQFQMFRSQVSQIAMQFGGTNINGQNTRGPVEPPFQLPESHKAEHKDEVIARQFPNIPMPSDWTGSMAPTPESGFEMHIGGNRHESEVYVRAPQVACGSSAEKGLVVRFATTDGGALVEGQVEVPRLMWNISKADGHSVHHFRIQPTVFNQPIRILERLKANAEPFEKWAFATTRADGSPIQNAEPGGTECDLDTTTTNGQLRAQMRCDAVPGELLVKGQGVHTDSALITVQFACALKNSIPATR